MNSKILTNEYSEKIGNGMTLYYGTKDEKRWDVITITVKGKYIPLTQKNDYYKDVVDMRNAFTIHVNNQLNESDDIDSHYIFTTDFTERGLSCTKGCKFKYTMFVKNVSKNKKYNDIIKELVFSVNNILKETFDLNGFDFYK